MSDLIAIGYPDEETAQKVWQELPPTTPSPGELSAGSSGAR
jgi:hypothetical protein